ncbi:MAG: hypothetical protein R6X02_01695, partial [Enhygromyxa sp.]
MDAREPPWDLDSLPPDVAILIALAEEFRTLASTVTAGRYARPSEQFGGYDYFFEGPGGYRCVATIMDAMGPTSASQCAQRLLAWHPAVIVNVGIAGGLKDDLRIGDVIVPREVAAYDETGKATGRSSDAPWEERRGRNYHPTPHLVDEVAHLQFVHEQAFRKWLDDAVEDLDTLLSADQRGPLDALLERGMVRSQPQTSTMHLASGSFVIASKPFAKWIRQANANIHAGEMEAAGMLAANEYRREPAKSLVIRGISDHVDYPKKRVDAVGGGALRGLAMRNAWRLLCTLMQLGLLPRATKAPALARGVLARELRTTPRFVGRVAELARLEALLLDAPEPRTVVAISGMPGVGKSYLADRFAVLHQSKFAGGVLRLSLNPDEDRSPAALAEELAHKLQVDRKELPASLANALLLIENLDSRGHVETVARLLDTLGQVRAIVSGRVRSPGVRAGWQQLPLDRLDQPTALELFAAWGCRPSSPPEREVLVGLARRLDFLPLALALAAGYLQGGGTVAGFEAELQTTKLALAPEDPTVLADEDRAARQIIRSSFDISLRLFTRETDRAARRALAAMGSALAQEFGEGLGRAVAQLEPVEFERLCRTATQLSLLECTLVSPKAPRFKFHPLIAEFLRNEFDDDTEAFGRLRRWFEPRMLDNEAGGRAELVAEQATLGAWLDRVPDALVVELSRAYEEYGNANGPYLAFAALHERASEAASDRRQRSQALHRLAWVLRLAGELDRSMEVARANADSCDEDDPGGRAVALGHVADILFARGDLDEALRIRNEEELPVYERLGDVRSRAVTLGKVADILFARGDLDEALRIRNEEQLPAFERLGDVRSRAVTLGKVTDILFARGDLDEALRILRKELLPAFERLGDVRSRAVTLGRVADILFARGDLDEALRIRNEEELPVYERL